MAMVNDGPREAGLFAAEVAAARTIFRAPLESIRRVAERLHPAPRHAHAARRASPHHRSHVAAGRTTHREKAKSHTVRKRSGGTSSHSQAARKRQTRRK
jgi:hypothetical protein